MSSLQAILTATLVEAMLESALYGFYSVIFMTVVYLFWVKPTPKRGPRLYLLAALVFQYTLATGHWICTIFYICRNFVTLGGGLAAAIAGGNGEPGVPSIVLFTISGFMALAFAIQRVLAVWANTHIVILFPSVLMVVYAVTTAVGITLEVRENATGYPFVITSTVLGLVISGYSTALIVWKIWRINTDVISIRVETGRAEKTLTSLLAIIAESFAIQTTVEVCILIAFVVNSAIGRIIFLPLAPTVTGISTILIHARVSLGWAREPSLEKKTEASTVVFRSNVTASALGSEREETELQQPRQKAYLHSG